MKPRNEKDSAAKKPSARADEEASPGVVQLSDARRVAQGRASASRAILAQDLEETRELLDRGLASEAETRLRHIISGARGDKNLLGGARCLLSMALEMRGRFIESLEVVKAYESAEGRRGLDAEVSSALRVQIGLAHNYNGDQPKAIALLNSELQDAEESGADARLGAIYVALARVYRHITEYSIARDHALKSLEHYRLTGDWRGMAESYFSIGLTSTHVGRYEEAIESYEQAAKIVGDRPAPYLLGRVYNNMAGAYWFLRRPHDGIRSLEMAVAYYERTEHKASAATGYNNLGINLTLIGEFERAQECLRRALELALQVDQSGSLEPMIYDSLGDLKMLRGDLEEAEQYLERAVRISKEHGNKWYERQAMCTLGRCHLLMGKTDEARAEGEEALALASKIEDRQAVYEATLLLAEARLREGALDECAALLEGVQEEADDPTLDIAVTAETQRLRGLLALERGDSTHAAHHLGRSHSIFEMLGDRYRSARAKLFLARAYAVGQPERAAEQAGLAAHAFRELGARLGVERAEEFLAELHQSAPAEHEEPTATAQLLTLRLAEAASSRELLLRELVAVVQQESKANRVLIIEPGEQGSSRVASAHGCTAEEGVALAAALDAAATEQERERVAREMDASVHLLRGSSAP
ncbi:MAG TPA: tetratricopeptide repeat protein, partial [Pyrinomonadaceae bacterium]|nr:tetratricopeptide repeat protein [Pyrinomonadaceae bacterium]